MKRQNHFVPIKFSLILFFSGHYGCTTVNSSPISQVGLERSIRALEAGCRLTPTSGFTADLGIMNQGGARIEAVWDMKGHLDGQILNAIGDDVLSFNIDSSGFLQIDRNISRSETVLQALEFISQLGASETRSLLCSGLFSNPEANHYMSKYGTLNEKEFWAGNRETQWLSESKIVSSTHSGDRIVINTSIKTRQFIFKKTLADVIWIGERKGEKMIPTSLSLSANKIEIKLSFLDFE